MSNVVVAAVVVDIADIVAAGRVVDVHIVAG